MIKWGLIALLSGALGALASPSSASACGCFSSPQPPPMADADAYAVNQQAEQIIFDVDEEAGTVTAHVLIQYAGAPESFAWILPTPTVPTLGLTADLPFALLDRLTAPQTTVGVDNVCPEQEYRCRRHPSCPTPSPPPGSSADAGIPRADASAADSGSTPSGPPVEVIDRQILGAYETITFAAGDTGAAITWLQGEGFIVNDTMAPFMQPYADAGMIFVAAKLVPEADVSGIKPLSLTYEGTMPMVPLRLTAVGAEPELTVTAWIFGDAQYRPMDQPLVVPAAGHLARDLSGRLNYPMALSRAIDAEENGAFVMEFDGPAPQPRDLFDPTCCGGGFDACGWAGDGICACPFDEWEAADCGDDLDEIVTLVEQLATNARVTRLTTRLGPHEMTYDPMFEPTTEEIFAGRLSLSNTQSSLASCVADIVDAEEYAPIRELEACAATWCGRGTCVLSDEGAGCACDPGFAARQFTDLDGLPSVTCVPEDSPVDLQAGGIELQSSCGGADCGLGRCVDQGGFPACVCDDGAGAIVTAEGAPRCVVTTARAEGAGADDYTGPLADIDVCSPRPPSCRDGWLERVPVSRQGVACARTAVDPARLVPLPPRDCPSLSRAGGGGGCAVSRTGTQTAGSGAVLSIFALFAFAHRRRRR